jgi:hypothetical protein
MIDKYSEYDQKLLRDVQVRLGNYSYDKDTYVPFVSGYPDTIVALRLMYGKNKIKQLEYE